MIADHGDVFWCDSSILPTMNKSFRNLVPDIEIAVHPWAPLSVVALMVSAWGSCTLERSALDFFPLKFGSAPQTWPWCHPLFSCIWSRPTCHRLDSRIPPLGFLLVRHRLHLHRFHLPNHCHLHHQRDIWKSVEMENWQSSSLWAHVQVLKYTKHRLTTRASSISLYHLSHRNINIALNVVWDPYLTYSLLWRAVQFSSEGGDGKPDIHAVNTCVRGMNVHSWAWHSDESGLEPGTSSSHKRLMDLVRFLGTHNPLASIAGRALCRERENSMAERTDIFKVNLSYKQLPDHELFLEVLLVWFYFEIYK